MKNIIVNLKDESDLYEQYNNNVSKSLIEYLIRESKYTKDDIKITVNTKLKVDNIESMIKNGLRDSYLKSKKIEHLNSLKQMMFLIIGIIFLMFSSINYNNNLIREILIIGGWVAIWEVFDISLNTDTELRMNRKLIRKLLACQIIIKN